MALNQVNPIAIQNEVKTQRARSTGKDFNAFLGAANAMGGTAQVAGGMYAGPNAATVITSAFSGLSQMPGSAPAYSMGMGKYTNVSGAGTMVDGSAPVVAGSDFSQMDMINTMNQNNLELLSLQATMQSNMQAWNTKSNILSADHRARMAMIEKFTARG